MPIVIGVAGGTGAGKSLLVEKVIERVGANHVALIQHDAYYRDRSELSFDERVVLNYDHPEALETSLLIEHLQELKDGRPVEVPQYDFSRHTRTENIIRIAPKPAIIVEGILVLADAGLRSLMDIRIFVDVDSDRRILRRLERDILERGRTLSSVVQQYLDTVRPMHLEFVDPSKQHAHVIIPEGGRNAEAMEMIISRIQALTESRLRSIE
jgi:uridine kinase